MPGKVWRGVDEPEFNPTGRFLAAVSFSRTDSYNLVVRWSVATDQTTSITGGDWRIYYEQPTWSPDSARIAALRHRDGYPNPDTVDVVIFPSTGGAQRVLLAGDADYCYVPRDWK